MGVLLEVRTNREIPKAMVQLISYRLRSSGEFIEESGDSHIKHPRFREIYVGSSSSFVCVRAEPQLAVSCRRALQGTD